MPLRVLCVLLLEQKRLPSTSEKWDAESKQNMTLSWDVTSTKASAMP